MVEVQQVCFWFDRLNVLLCDAMSSQSKDFVKRDSVSKFSPRGEDNTS